MLNCYQPQSPCSKLLWMKEYATMTTFEEQHRSLTGQAICLEATQTLSHTSSLSFPSLLFKILSCPQKVPKPINIHSNVSVRQWVYLGPLSRQRENLLPRVSCVWDWHLFRGHHWEALSLSVCHHQTRTPGKPDEANEMTFH